MTVLATITDPAVVVAILAHVGAPTEALLGSGPGDGNKGAMERAG